MEKGLNGFIDGNKIIIDNQKNSTYIELSKKDLEKIKNIEKIIISNNLATVNIICLKNIILPNIKEILIFNNKYPILIKGLYINNLNNLKINKNYDDVVLFLNDMVKIRNLDISSNDGRIIMDNNMFQQIDVFNIEKNASFTFEFNKMNFINELYFKSNDVSEFDHNKIHNINNIDVFSDNFFKFIFNNVDLIRNANIINTRHSRFVKNVFYDANITLKNNKIISISPTDYYNEIYNLENNKIIEVDLHKQKNNNSKLKLNFIDDNIKMVYVYSNTGKERFTNLLDFANSKYRKFLSNETIEKFGINTISEHHIMNFSEFLYENKKII